MVPPIRDDDTLMIRTADGEEAAFRLLVQRWEHEVKNFLIHMLGSVEEAEDLTQDTFVKIYQTSGSFRPAGNFKSWLFKIAGNLARSRLRRRKVLRWIRFEPERHETGDAAKGPAVELEEKQQEMAVREALARLPLRQREALVLHRFQGLRYREVARSMGTTVPGVESLIQRAMAALRKDLGEKGDLK